MPRITHERKSMKTKQTSIDKIPTLWNKIGRELDVRPTSYPVTAIAIASVTLARRDVSSREVMIDTHDRKRKREAKSLN